MALATVEHWKDRVGDAAWDRRMKYLARFGYGVKGVLYAIVAFLAFQTAWYGAGSTPGSKGAIATLRDEPFGEAMLWAVGIGLFFYAAYRIIQAVLDPEKRGSEPKALAKRVGMFASGLTHIALGVFALSLVTDWFGSSGGGGKQALTARIMAEPFGRWAVVAAGIGVAIAALWQLKRAIKGEVFKDTRAPDVPANTKKWIHRLGRLGFAARAVTFGLISWFLIQAAVQYDPSEAGGLGKALSTIAQQPFGTFLLGVVALGLFGYAMYCFVKARYLELRNAT